MNDLKKDIIIATGGTGGHIFPAIKSTNYSSQETHKYRANYQSRTQVPTLRPQLICSYMAKIYYIFIFIEYFRA